MGIFRVPIAEDVAMGFTQAEASRGPWMGRLRKAALEMKTASASDSFGSACVR